MIEPVCRPYLAQSQTQPLIADVYFHDGVDLLLTVWLSFKQSRKRSRNVHNLDRVADGAGVDGAQLDFGVGVERDSTMKALVPSILVCLECYIDITACLWTSHGDCSQIAQNFTSGNDLIETSGVLSAASDTVGPSGALARMP